MNTKAKKALVFFGPLAVAVGVLYLLNKKSKNGELYGAATPTPAPEPVKTVLPPPPPTAVFPLKTGSKGEKVKELQRALGFSGTDVDGDFGGKTETRLLAFAGLKQVDSQAELDRLKNMAAGLTNLERAKQLVTDFSKGGLALYTVSDTALKQVSIDAYGAHIPTGTVVNLKAGFTYNNTDYKITGATKSGLVTVQVTQGTNAGTYDVDPNKITLKKVA